MIDWEKLKKECSLEDFYNILCRNKPHRNDKMYKEWDFLESITYEELLNENECDKLIDEIIIFLKKQKMSQLKETEERTIPLF